LEAVGLAGRVEGIVNVSGSSGNALWRNELIPRLAAHASSKLGQRRHDSRRRKGRAHECERHRLAEGLQAPRPSERTKAGYVGTSFRVP